VVVSARKIMAILKTVLNGAVKAVNFNKARATNSGLFLILCIEMGCDHDKSLFVQKIDGFHGEMCYAAYVNFVQKCRF
jgi:hypothetical protein